MSEQEQDGKTKQPEEPKKEKKDVFVLTLLPGETAKLERAPKKKPDDPPQWNVRVDTPGRKNDQVRVTYPMDAELEVTGMATDATIIIPKTIGQNKSDIIPRFNIRSDNPPIIEGNAIITGGKAIVEASPKEFLKDQKPVINDGSDPKLEKDSMSIQLSDGKGNRRTVTVEREPETSITFIDPSTKDPKKPESKPKPFYTLSALNPEDSMRDYDAVIANRAREEEQKKSGGNKKEPPKETRNLKPLNGEEQQAVRQSLADARTSLEQLKGSSFAKDADLQGLIDLSNNIMVGNTINQDKLKEFRTKLDQEIDKTIQNSSPLEGGLNRIRDKLNENDSLKISMNEQLSPQALAAATGAARGAAAIILAQADAGSSNKSPLQTEAKAQGLAGGKQA